MTLHLRSEPGVVSDNNNLSQIRNSLIALLGDGEAMAVLHRAAERYARVPRGSLIARELVADVVGDMYAGTTTRNPEQPQLATQLLDEVQLRAKRARRKSNHHVPIDGLRNDETPAAEVPVERADDRNATVLRQLLAQARSDVGEDPSARQLIALYELKVIRKRDVLRFGMPEGAYRAARARVLAALRARARCTETEHPTEHAAYRSVDPERLISALVALRRLGTRRAESGRGAGCAGAQTRRVAAGRKR